MSLDEIEKRLEERVKLLEQRIESIFRRIEGKVAALEDNIRLQGAGTSALKELDDTDELDDEMFECDDNEDYGGHMRRRRRGEN